jgi:hypothetical protein
MAPQWRHLEVVFVVHAGSSMPCHISVYPASQGTVTDGDGRHPAKLKIGIIFA